MGECVKIGDPNEKNASRLLQGLNELFYLDHSTGSHQIKKAT